jgi:hypothetical protein
MKITVSLNMTPCNLVDSYESAVSIFRIKESFYPYNAMEAAVSSKMLVNTGPHNVAFW